MGCGSSSNKTSVSPPPQNGDYATPFTPHKTTFAQNPTPEPRPLQPRPPPLTFEVPIERRSSGGSGGGTGNSNNTENLVRLHPPRRLLRLDEQPVKLTHQVLDDRLAEADLRRQRILNQRILSASVRKHKRKPVTMDTDWKVSGAEEQPEDFRDKNTTIATYV